MRSSFVFRLSSAFHRIDPYVGLILTLTLFAVLPLAGPHYFFGAHDAPNSIFFLTEFDAAIRDGVWYPGWATDQALGYGYPTFVLYPPLAYYVAEVFHLLGAGTVAAVKWTWALATVGAGLAMYAYARHVMGRQRGLLAAVVYMYVPYHLVDIYVRAALAEYFSFVWMPLALLAFHCLVEKVTARRLALAGLAFGALWLAHNVTALAFTPLLAGYVLFRLLAKARAGQSGRKEAWPATTRRGAAALGGSLLGLGIAAALILPNLLERSLINQEQWVQAGYDYSQHFVYPSHLLSSAWGYAPGVPGVDGVMSFQLGAVPLILAMVATVSAFRRPARERALILFCAGATLVLIFFMTPLSAWLWQAVPLAALIQFPWRLLALTAVTLSFLSGLAMPEPSTALAASPQSARLPTTHLPILGSLMLALVAILGSFAYTLPQYTSIPESAEGPLLSIEFELKYTDMRGMTRWTQEMPPDSPLVTQYQAGGPLVTATALAPGASVEMIRAAGASDELWVRSPQGTALRFYTYYFPGWRVYVDGQRLPDSALRPETLYGLLTVDVPPGEHHVLLRWGDTPVRLTGKGLTLACLALALVLVVLPQPLGKRIKL
jgi:hypothetical protein